MIAIATKRGKPVDKTMARFWKSGLMGYGNEHVGSAWVHMNSPRRSSSRTVASISRKTAGDGMGGQPSPSVNKQLKPIVSFGLRRTQSRSSTATRCKSRFAPRRRKDTISSLDTCTNNSAKKSKTKSGDIMSRDTEGISPIKNRGYRSADTSIYRVW
jgi:hypothetical protein